MNGLIDVLQTRQEISPRDRETQSFPFRPCQSTARQIFVASLTTPETERFTLYMAISDAPFISEPRPNLPLSDFLVTEGDRPVELLNWDLEFTADDPSATCQTF